MSYRFSEETILSTIKTIESEFEEIVECLEEIFKNGYGAAGAGTDLTNEDLNEYTEEDLDYGDIEWKEPRLPTREEIFNLLLEVNGIKSVEEEVRNALRNVHSEQELQDALQQKGLLQRCWILCPVYDEEGNVLGIFNSSD